MTEENRSASLGGSADSSAIQTGDGNTATITITNYYYREQTTVIPIESTDVADRNLPCPYRGLFHFSPDDTEFFCCSKKPPILPTRLKIPVPKPMP